MNKTRESYSTSMQFGGVRGGVSVASKSLFWQARKGLSYVLTLESERDRNATIIIARKCALDCHVSKFLCTIELSLLCSYFQKSMKVSVISTPFPPTIKLENLVVNGIDTVI